MAIEDLEEVQSMDNASSLTAWSREMFLGEMAHPHGFCFVVTAGRVIGFICFRNIGEESELLNICVHPDHRRARLGRELMQFYITFSVERGIKTFHLEVHRGNQPALQLYHMFSYRSIGLRPRYYRGEFDALRMVKHVS